MVDPHKWLFCDKITSQVLVNSSIDVSDVKHIFWGHEVIQQKNYILCWITL